MQHQSFLSGAWDAGYFDQLMWRTLTEKVLFKATGDFVNPGGYFFGAHFSPVLFIIFPFYALYPNMLTLIVIQNAAIALTAVPLYIITRKKLNDKSASLFIALVFLLYPPLHGAAWFFFHVEAFFPIFVSLFFISLIQEKKLISFLFLFLALSVTEFAGIMVTLVIVFVIFEKKGFPKLRIKNIEEWLKKTRFEIILITICILWVFLGLSIINLFNPNRLLLRWDTLGGNLLSQLIGLITKPDIVIRTLAQNPYDKFFYLSMIFAPVLFIPMLRPSSLVMILPYIFISFLSPVSVYWNPLAFHYPLWIVAQIFIATIYGLESLTKSKVVVNTSIFDKIKGGEKYWDIRKVVTISILFTVTLASIFSPINSNLDLYGRVINSERNKALTEILKLIPETASVSTINNIFPHLAHRDVIYPFAAKADYILIDTRSPWWPGPIPSQLNVYNPDFDTFIWNLHQNKSIGLLTAYDGVFLWKWSYNGPVMNVFLNKTIGLTAYYFQDPSLMLYNDYAWELFGKTSQFLNKKGSMQPVLLENKGDNVVTFRGRLATFPNGNYTLFVRAYTLGNLTSTFQFGLWDYEKWRWYESKSVVVNGTPCTYNLNFTMNHGAERQPAYFTAVNCGSNPVILEWAYIIPQVNFEMKVINPNFNWFIYSPVPGFLKGGYYGILFKGYFLAHEDGNYTFILNSDDTSILLIDNVRIGSGSLGLGLTNEQSTIYLEKGFHEVTLLYGNFFGGGSINLEVRKDNVSCKDYFYSEPCTVP